MEETQSTAPEAAQSPTDQKLGHFGLAGELFAITLINLLFKVVTLGIYHFWGKTRVRQYVWSHTRFAGEQFEYVGRGGELLRGYLIAMVIIIPVGALWQYVLTAYAFQPAVTMPVLLAGYAFFLFFSGLALFSSRRYLLSRTRWRGVRFGMSGSAIRHGRKMLVYSIVYVLTLGIYFPFMRSNLYKHLADNSWVGDRQASYEGRGRGLLWPYIWFFLLSIFILGVFMAVIFGTVQVMGMGELSDGAPAQPSPLVFVMVAFLYAGLGINWLWYRASEFRYLVEQTALGEVRLRTDFRTGQYIWLWTSNMLLLGLTFGLAYAWVVVRTARFLSDHIHLEGELDLAAIQQTAQQIPKTGEGLAEALDLGGI